ncbi:AAA family ATPase [Corynebacterium variabile]|uniref:AAA family ATPase n=1 Tax=Corynebacterium variabile TaxID=1727 RepID=UPI003A95B502
MTDTLSDAVKNRAAELNVVDGVPWDKAVAQAQAEQPEQTATEQTATEPAGDTPRRRITFTPASKIRTEAIDWLLDCWVPRGSVTLLGGREGIGKSTIAVDWVAQATTGKLTGTPMNVAYVVTEDSPEHTVVPRLKAAGADLDRVLFLAATVPDPDKPGITYESSLDLPGDYPILKTFITEQSIGLVVLDAAKSVMSSKLKGNDDLDIRRFLEPMHRVAQGTGCTFVCLVHFSAKKGSADTGNLIMGSSAWQQVARSVVAVAEDRDNSTVKVWNSKANLAPRIRTMEAQVVTAGITTDDGRATEVGRIEWIGECDEDGSALLNPESDGAGDDADEVKMIVLDYLASNGGSAPAGDVLRAANAAGLSSQTVKNKRKQIGVSTQKRGKEWVWSIEGTGKVAPSSPTASAGTFGTLVSSQVAGGNKVPEHGEGTEGTKVPGATDTGPSDQIILGALDLEFGLSPDTVAGSVPGLTRADAPGRLHALAEAGLVAVDARGRYTRTATEGAAA